MNQKLNHMGTNFYIQQKISKQYKTQLMELVKNEDWDNLKENILSLIKENIPEKIHIGKRSAGWKFLWNANNFKYFTPNKESLMEFLKSGQIYNEYGEKFSFDQFINEEIAPFLSDDLWDIESYYKEGNIKFPHIIPSDKRMEFSETHGVNVNIYGEFYIDNLRFTTYDEFS